MAPSPYHAHYRYEHCLPTIKSTAELAQAHPPAAYRQHEGAWPLRDEVVRRCRPAYRG